MQLIESVKHCYFYTATDVPKRGIIMQHFKRIICCMLFLILFSACYAQAEELSAVVPITGGTVEISSTVIDGEHWSFLPSQTGLQRYTLQAAGVSRPFPAQFTEEDGVITAEVDHLTVHVMCSENIRSLFLFSSDPEQQGRAYIDSSSKHSTFTTASMALLSSDGHVDHIGKITKLRGRGNSTWHIIGKKPYQFKLESRMDLLDTGNPAERNRTWVLLALATDSTYLHDRITLDLARELGDETASYCEHVNLYYDGEYRGLYLLCEKTEINSGRIDELDYDKLIESWNQHSGNLNLDTLPSANGQNRFGNEFTYLQDVPETDNPGAGAFLLEIENEWMTLSDPCWFRLSNGSVLASKNPEKASESMIRYVSERLEEAWQTLQHRGINPETGRTLADDFDIEAFARSVLISEWSSNLDSYSFSSTYFILPAGESRFEPGPPWDCDLAYRYDANPYFVLDASGFRSQTGWIPSFFNCPDFVREVQRECQEQFAPTVEKILLGTETGVHLKPLNAYVAEIDAARRMNEKIWDTASTDNRLIETSDFETDIALLKQFLTERSEWLFETVENWDPDGADQVDLWADASYVHIDGTLRLQPMLGVNAKVVSCTYEKIAEATEEAYALWQLDAVVAPLDGFFFSSPVVTVNGTEVDFTMLEDGTLSFSFLFEDPSYRPVDAYGEDIGLVYNYDTYIRLYPEVAEACDDDPELVMDYFLYDGMYEDHRGNLFFQPSEILHNNPRLREILGQDWWNYYTEYISYGWMEWQLPAYARFKLNVLPIL